MKKKSNVTKTLIGVLFLIGIIAILTPALAAKSNHVLFIARGDDLDFPNTTDFIMGKIENGEGGVPALVDAVFHQKIYDDAGEKLYEMKGILKNGVLLTRHHYFYCPIFEVYFINVSWVMGEGVVKTSDTELTQFFRTLFPITLPNTEGKYVSAPILMFISPTAEYCFEDPGVYRPGTLENPINILEQGPWALAAVIWEVNTPMGLMELPVGPLCPLT